MLSLMTVIMANKQEIMQLMFNLISVFPLANNEIHLQIKEKPGT